MTAVFKREFKSFFTSPVGYVVLARGDGAVRILFLCCITSPLGMSALSGVFENLFSIPASSRAAGADHAAAQ